MRVIGSECACKRGEGTANLPANIVDFRGVLLKHNLNLKGWNSHVHRKFTGRFESSNVSRDNVSREMGRKRGEGTAD